MVKKESLEEMKFLWLAAITSAGGLMFTLAYALLIFFIAENGFSMSTSEVFALLVVVPVAFSSVGMYGYHLGYRILNSKEKLGDVDVLDQVISKRFRPKRQVATLAAILSLLLLSVLGTLFGVMPVAIYYAIILTAISYMVAIVVYNSTIAYIISSELSPETWNQEVDKGLYYSLYVEEED